MGKIVFQEMKKIFMRPVIRVALILFFVAAIYFASFISGGISYYYDTERDVLVELPTSFYLEKEYTHRIKGTITDQDLERYYSEYQELMEDVNNYSNEINLQEQKDRRYELLGEGFSEAEIDQIDEEEPLYELKPYIKYNKLWNYQPIKHLFQLYYTRNDYHILRGLLSEGILFDWCGGYVHAIRLANNILSIFIGILIILGISTVFSEESQYKIKGMISTTAFGRGKLIYGKIISSVLYTIIIVAAALCLDLIVSEIVYGLGNGDVYIQLSSKFMNYDVLISHSRLFWEEWFCIFVGAQYLNAIVLLISSVSYSDFVSVLTTFILYFIFGAGTLLLNIKNDRWKLFLPTTLMSPLEYFERDQPYIISIIGGVIFGCIAMLASVYNYKKNIRHC